MHPVKALRTVFLLHFSIFLRGAVLSAVPSLNHTHHTDAAVLSVTVLSRLNKAITESITVLILETSTVPWLKEVMLWMPQHSSLLCLTSHSTSFLCPGRCWHVGEVVCKCLPCLQCQSQQKKKDRWHVLSAQDVKETNCAGNDQGDGGIDSWTSQQLWENVLSC